MTEALKNYEWLINLMVTAIIAPVVLIGVKWYFKQSEKRTKLDRDEREKRSEVKWNEWKDEYRKKKLHDTNNAIKVVVENGRLRELLDADSVFIVQPHPTGRYTMCTAWLEAVRENFAFLTKDELCKHIPIGRISKLVGSLSTESFFIRNVKDATDPTAQSILATSNVEVACCKMLKDSAGNWVGSLLATNPKAELKKCAIEEAMTDASLKICQILPEIDY